MLDFTARVAYLHRKKKKKKKTITRYVGTTPDRQDPPLMPLMISHNSDNTHSPKRCDPRRPATSSKAG